MANNSLLTTTVIFRESGVSSTPQLFDSITGASEYWIARFRGRRRLRAWRVRIIRRTFTTPRRDAPESCLYLPPPRGRGERRMPNAPAASCALCSGRTHTSNNEYTGITRHSRTQWF
jgi:hypothetical protein